MRSELFSSEAEQGVIGAILLDGDILDDVSGIIKPEDFYYPYNRAIYMAMLKCSSNNEAVDAISVLQYLDADNESAADPQYVSDLIHNTPGSSNVVSYAKIVKNKSIERSLSAASITIDELAHDPSLSPSGKIDAAQSVLMEMGEKSTHGPMHVSGFLSDYIDLLESRNEGKLNGIKTGYGDLDRYLHGLMNGDLIIVAGRPSMGKTTFAMNIAENAAINGGVNVAIFSLEMPGEQLIDKMVSSIGGVLWESVRTGNLTNEEWGRVSHATKRIHESGIYIDDPGYLAIDDLRGRARRLKKKNHIGLIVVDYLQLLSAPGTENRVNEISKISRGLKSLAKELHVPVIALSQLNRELEKRTNKRPILSDLRESGSLEQDADVILCVYRDEVYNNDSPDRDIAEAIIRKQRVGRLGVVKLYSKLHYSKFEGVPR